MLLFTLLFAFISLAASLTLNKTDGTTLVLGDEPMIVDLSDVIMPLPEMAPDPIMSVHLLPQQNALLSTSVHVKINTLSNSSDIGSTDAGGEPVYMIQFYKDTHHKGIQGVTQSCDMPLNRQCRRTDSWSVSTHIKPQQSQQWKRKQHRPSSNSSTRFPDISSLSLQGCRYGQLNYGVPFGCFFWDTSNCDRSPGKNSLWLTYGVDDLGALKWDNRIRAYECHATK
ncbi:uncharacterized protein K460DRAFT_404011 [Cucurbitaria berberidis CBS 394.84]|uniref:Uncharacterized protein n=1 Tax=Cucurbitaria berberidis CBS 394.84 TaxID=1168544 RepID=A0A9P4GP35_9PLEO|nr:uncharacterized protein K460DRAFT_404011 [Cucurbitaria berberidis CBS 394.84]KAF1848742.1 hypothetical protein K460DRAFT_404011 [Cucurbitaria berberidis CBS 394.84]